MNLISINGKFISIFILISLIIFIAGLAFYFFYKDTLWEQISKEEYNDVSPIIFALDESKERLEQASVRAANYQAVRNYLKYGLEATKLQSLMQELIANESLATLAITQWNALVMVYPDDDLARSENYIQNALENKSITGFELIGDRVLIRSAVPILDVEKDSVIGSIITGSFLDENELFQVNLKRFSAKESDYAIFVNNKLFLTSSEKFPPFLQKDRFDLAPENKIDNIVTEIEGKKYIITSYPFMNNLGKVIGTIVVGRYNHFEEAFLAEFILHWVVILGLMLIAGLFITRFFIKKLDRPLIELNEVVSQVQEGDMKARVQMESPVEIANIGRKFNAVVTRIAQMIKDEQNRRHELKKLNEAAKKISSMIDLNVLLHLIIEAVMAKIEVGGCSIFLTKDGEVERLENRASSASPEMSSIVANFINTEEKIAKDVFQNAQSRMVNRIEEVYNVSKFSPTRHTALVSIPFINRGVTLGVMNIYKNYDENESTGFSDGEFNFLKALAGQASISVDNAMLYEQIAVEERMQKEVEITSDIKNNIFPEEVPEVPGMEFGHHLWLAKLDGGDYYDFIEHRTEKYMGLVMADVMSRGMQAAIITTIARMTIRSSAPYIVDPQKIIATLNSALREHMSESCRLRATYALWNSETQTLSFCGVGQSALMVFQNGAVNEQQYFKKSIGANDFSEDELNTITIKLNPGDAFMLFSDGMLTARNDGRKWFNTEIGLKSAFLNSARSAETAKEIEQGIIKAVEKFTGDVLQIDDASFIVGRVPGSSSAEQFKMPEW